MAYVNQFSKYGGSQNAKALNAYDDPAVGSAELSVDSLEVTGDAVIDGQLTVSQLTPTTMGAYTQDGAVDFNFSTLSNANVVSGKISGVTILNSKGYFTYLNSGKPGTGYEVKFYGSGDNSMFHWNGLRNYLSIKSNTIIGSSTPYHNNSELQIAPEKPNSVTGALVTSVVGTIVTGDFSGVQINPGDYIALQDGNNLKITSVDSSGSFLSAVNPLGINQPSISSTYSIHNAGWYFDKSGNLLAEGYGYLQLPKVDPANPVTFSTTLGLLRWNQNKMTFEAYGTEGWVPLALNGYVTNKDFNTGLKVESDPDSSGLDMVRFFQPGTNTMTINAKGQVTLGTTTSPPNDQVKFYVDGDSLFDGTITGSALSISHQASISGPLSLGSDLIVAGDSTVSGNGVFGSDLTVGGSSSISGNQDIQGSLTVVKDIFTGGSATISSGLYVGSNASILGSLSVSSDFYGGGAGTYSGGLSVASNTSLLGSLTLSKDLLVGQSATISNGLYVGSSTTIAGSLTVQKTLNVSQSASISSNLTVGNNASVAGSLSLSKALNVGQYASISGNISGSANASFLGTLSTGKDAYIGGSASISAGLSVGSSAFLGSNLTVANNQYVGGSGSYTGGLAVGSNATIGGTLTVDQTLIVKGDTEFQGNLRVRGNIISDGTMICVAQVVLGPSSISGPLSLGGDMSMSGSLSIGKSLLVASNTTLLQSLSVGSDISGQGSLSIAKSIFASGSGYLGGSLTVVGNQSVLGSLSVSKDSYVGGSSSVTGNLLVGSSATVSGALNVKKNLVVDQSATILSGLYVGSNATIAGTLSVQQSLIVSRAASFLSNVSTGSNLSVSGSVSVSQDLSVTGTGTILGYLYVGSSATINGSLSVNNDLSVAGNATINSLQVVRDINTSGNLGVNGSVTAQGSVKFGSNLSLVGNANMGGSLAILGDLAIAHAATIAGSLFVGSGATFSQDVNFAKNVYVSGSESISGSLTVGSNTSIYGSLNVQRDLSVTGSATISNNLYVSNSATIGATLSTSVLNVTTGGSIAGTLYVGSNATFAGSVSINKTLNVSGTGSIGGNLTVGSDTSLSGNLGISKNILVQGSSTFVGNVYGSGSAIFSTVVGSLGSFTYLDVANYASLGGSLSVTGNIVGLGSASIGGYLSVQGPSTLSGTVVTGADLFVSGSSSVTGDTSVAGGAFVQGSLTAQSLLISSYATIGTLTVTGNEVVLGSLSVNKSLQVSGIGTFGSTLYASSVFASMTSLSGNLISGGTLIAVASSISGRQYVGSLSVASYGSFGGAVVALGNVSGSTFTGKSMVLSNDANISGSLTVNGSTTFNNNVFINGTVTALASNFIYGGGGSSGGGGGTVIVMNSSGGATVTGTALNIINYSSLNGPVYIGSDANILGGLNVGSDLNVTGTIVGSSIYITGGSTFLGPLTLGSDLNVAGNETISGNLVVNRQTTLFGTVSISQDLVLGGSETITGGLSVGSNTNLLGSVTVYQLLQVLKGLSVTGNFGLVGSESISGSLTVGKTLLVSQGGSFLGGLSVGSNVFLQQNLSVSGSLSVIGSSSIGGNLAVVGTVTAGKDIIVQGTGTILGSLFIGGSQTISGSLSVQKDILIGQSATVSGGLYVGSNTTIAGTLTLNQDMSVGGSSSISGFLYVGSNTTIAGSLSVSQDFQTGGAGTFGGSLYVGGSGTIAGSLSVTSSLNVGQSASISSSLYVGNNASVAGSLSVLKDLSVAGSGTFTGSVFVGSNQIVSGTATQKQLYVSNSAQIAGSLTVGSYLSVTGSIAGQSLFISGPGTITGFFTAGTSASVGGNLAVNKGLSVNQYSSVLGNAYVGGNEVVIGSSTVQKSLAVGQSATVLGGLFVGSSATIAGSLTVDQDFFVNNSGTILGNLFIGSSATIQGSLSVSQDIYSGGVGSFASGLWVGSDTSILGTVNVSEDLNVGGAFSLSGPSFFSGDATFSGSLTVEGPFIADQSGAFGGSLTVGSNLRVNGSMSVLNNAAFSKNITLNGSLTAGSGIYSAGVASVTGGLFVGSDSSLSGNVNIAKTLTVAGGQSIQGGLYVGNNSTFAGSVSINKSLAVNSNASVSGGLFVGSNASISGSLTISQGLNVLTSASISSNLYVGNSSTVAGSLSVLGDASFSNSATIASGLYVGQSATIGGSLTVQQDAHIDGSGTILGGLYVGSSATIAGSLTVENDLYAAGSTTISSGLSVGSNALINGTLTVQQDFSAAGTGTVSGNLSVGSSMYIQKGLNVTGTSTFQNTATFGSNVNMQGSLSVSKDVTIGGNQTVSGNVYVAKSQEVGGSLTVDKSLSVGQATTLSSNLYVGSSATIAGSLTVGSGVTAPYGSFSSLSVATFSGNSFFNGTLTASAIVASNISGNAGGTTSTQIGSLTTSTITGSALNIAYYASVVGPLVVSSYVQAGSFFGTYASFTSIYGSNLTLTGSITGKIGYPSGQTSYGGLNFASLTGTDNLSDALQKLDNSLQLLNTQLTNYVEISGTVFTIGSVLSTGTILGTSLSVFGPGSVTGNIYGGSSLYVNNDASISGNLTSGSTVTGNVLRIKDDSQLDGNLRVSSNLTVDGSITLNGPVRITGPLIADYATISNMSISTNLSVGGNITTAGDLNAGGNIAGQNLQLSGSQSIAGSLSVGSGLVAPQAQITTLTTNSISSQYLNVSSDGSFGGNLNIANTLTANSASLSGSLSVPILSSYSLTSTFGSFSSSLGVGGNLSVIGSSSVTGNIVSNGSLIGSVLSAFAGSIVNSLVVGKSITTGTLTASNINSTGSFTSTSINAQYGSFTKDVTVSGSLTSSSASITNSAYIGTLNSSVSNVTMANVASDLTVGGYIVGQDATFQSIVSASVTASVGSFSDSIFSNNASISGNFGAQSITSDFISAITGSYSNTLYANQTIADSGYYSSDVTSAGTVTAGSIYSSYSNVSNDLSVGGTFSGVSATLSGKLLVSSLSATYGSLGRANISSMTASTASISGTLSSAYIQTSTLTGLYGSFSSSLTSKAITASSGSISVLQTSTVTGIYGRFIGPFSIGGSLTVKNSIQSSGDIITSGNISADAIAASSASLSGFLYGSSSMISGDVAVGGNVTATSLSAVNAVFEGSVSGYLGSFTSLQSSSMSAETLIVQGSGSFGSSISAGSADITTDLTVGGSLTALNLAASSGSFIALSSAVITSSYVTSQSLTVADGLTASTVSAGQGNFLGTVTGLSFYGTYASFAGQILGQAASITSTLYAQQGSFAGNLSGRNMLLRDTLQASTVVGSALISTSYASVTGNIAASSASLSGNLASMGTVIGVYGSFIGLSVDSTITASAGYFTGSLGASSLNISNDGSFGGTLTASYGNFVNDLNSGGNVSGITGSFTNYIVTSTLTATSISSSYSSISDILSVGSYITAPAFYGAQASLSGSLLVGGTLTTSAASVSGLIQTGSLSTNNLSVSTITAGSLAVKFASISGTLNVGGAIQGSIGSFTGALYGSNAVFSGPISGLIGMPSTGTVYGPPNPASLTASDTLADALQKLDIQLSKVTGSRAPLPDPNSLGQFLVDVRGYTLYLEQVTTFTACIANRVSTISNLVIDHRPCTRMTTPLYDGASGVITAYLKTGTVSAAVGSVQLDLLPYGGNTISGYLSVTDKEYFYDDGSTQSLPYTYFECQIVPTSDLLGGSTTYGYQLYHNITGLSNVVSFRIDDSLTPIVSSISLDLIAASTTFISGVQTYVAGSSVNAVVSVSNVISSHYNYQYGLASAISNVFAEQYENRLTFRNVDSFTTGSSQTVSFPFKIPSNTQVEAIWIRATAYNAINQSTTSTVTISQRIDTISFPSLCHVTSGQGAYPSVPGVDFGLPYDHSVSLISIPELQLLAGRYRVPEPVDYSAVGPNDNPDYSDVRGLFAYRYTTFAQPLGRCHANVTIVFDDIAGNGWGDGHTPASNMTLHVRVLGNDSADTGWLDANAFFSGELTYTDGNPCLLSSETTACRKRITFGAMRVGTIYIRVGFESILDTDHKSFSGIRIETLDRCRVTDMASKVLNVSDYMFKAYIAGTAVLVENLCDNEPTFAVIQNFYDGNDGCMSAHLYIDNVYSSVTGSIDLAAVAVGRHKRPTEEGNISVFDKFDIFKNDPNKAGYTYAASVRLRASSNITPSGSEYAYQIIHSITGKTNKCRFRVDDPGVPLFKTSIDVNFRGPVRYLSGIPSFCETATVTASFTAGNVVSYYYNSYFGLATFYGNFIITITEQQKRSQFPTYPAFQDVSLNLETSIKPGIASVNQVLNVRIYNSVGRFQDQTVALPHPVVIDSISIPTSQQVTSGSGSKPGVIGIDFGLPYDHTESLLSNEELMFRENKYQLPESFDFTSCNPAGPDYTNVLVSSSFRYVTFQSPLKTSSCNAFLKFYGIEGIGWGDRNHLASDMIIQIRILSSITQQDSGWLNANSFFDISEDDAGCLLADHTSPSVKHLILPFAAQVAYVRIGLYCQSITHKKFTSVSLVCHPDIHAFGHHQLILSGTRFDACSVSSGLQTFDISHASQLQTVPYTFKTRKPCTLEAVFAKNDVVVSRNSIEIPHYYVCGKLSSGILTLHVEDAIHDDEVVVEARIGMTVALPFDPMPMRYTLWDRSHNRRVHTRPFYLDRPLSPSFEQIPVFSFDSKVRWISGVLSITTETCLTITIKAKDVIGFYFNHQYGFARVYSICLADVNVLTQGWRPSVTQETQSFDLQTRCLGDRLSEDLSLNVSLIAPDGTSSDAYFDRLASIPVRADTTSSLVANHVKSGSGQYPGIADQDFGTSYDDTQSLMSNSELQLYGGKFQVPVAKDYSKSFPIGSPDYTLVNQNVAFRYATFVFDDICSSCCVIRILDIEDDGWGDDDNPATDMSLQIQVVSHNEQTGWLDANAFYDGVTTALHQGDGCLLSNGTCKDSKFITFGRNVFGRCFVRIGFKCSDSSYQKRFRSIFIRSQVRQDTVPYLRFKNLEMSRCVAVGSGHTFDDIIAAVKPRTQLVYLSDVRRLSVSILTNQTQTMHTSIDVEKIRSGSSVSSGSLIVNKLDEHDSSIEYNIVPISQFQPGFDRYAYKVKKNAEICSSTFAEFCSNTLTFHVDDPLIPNLISIIATFIDSARYVSGVLTPIAQQRIRLNMKVGQAVSYYINDIHGIARIGGAYIEEVSEKSQRNIDISSLKPHQDVTFSMISRWVDDVYSEGVKLELTLYNSVGQTLKQIVPLFAEGRIRVDTVSKDITEHVSSGIGEFPQIPGIDFGSPYDHSISLIEAPELQLLNGKFQCPSAVDYSVLLPSGSPDYSTINSSFSYRYTTFKFVNQCCLTHFSIEFHDIEGSGWGGGGQLGSDMTLYVRVIEGGIDTHWLNANSFINLGDHFSNTDGCPCLLHSSTSHTKNVSFAGACLSGDLYVRVGFDIRHSSDKKFSKISIDGNDHKYQTIDFNIVNPVSGIITSSHHPVDHICRRPEFKWIDLNIARCWTRPQGRGGFVAGATRVEIFHDAKSVQIIGCFELTTLACGTTTINQFLQVKRSARSDICSVIINTAGLSLIPSVVPYHVRIMTQGISEPLTSGEFYVDDAVAPSCQAANGSVVGTVSYLSGIQVAGSKAAILCTATIANAVSYFYKSNTIGSVMIDGCCIGGFSDAYPPHEIVNINTQIAIPDGLYWPGGHAEIFAYNVFGEACNTRLTDKRIMIDTVSSPSKHRVTSGSGLYPLAAGTDFGQVYDHRQSLLINQELYLSNGRISLPPAVDFSKFMPDGSPDYTNVNVDVPIRWYTIKKDVECFSGRLTIRISDITGSAWGDVDDLADGIKLFIRVMNISEDSGWLNANAWYDGGSLQDDGDACLISDGTTRSTKSVILPCSESSTVYLRLGICSPDPHHKSFSGMEIVIPSGDTCQHESAEKSAMGAGPFSAPFLELIKRGRRGAQPLCADHASSPRPGSGESNNCIPTSIQCSETLVLDAPSYTGKAIHSLIDDDLKTPIIYQSTVHTKAIKHLVQKGALVRLKAVFENDDTRIEEDLENFAESLSRSEGSLMRITSKDSLCSRDVELSIIITIDASLTAGTGRNTITLTCDGIRHKLDFYVDQKTAPVVSDINIDLSGASRSLSGLRCFSSDTVISASCNVSNAWSYFIPKDGVILELYGENVKHASFHPPTSGLRPFESVTPTLSSTLDGFYSESIDISMRVRTLTDVVPVRLSPSIARLDNTPVHPRQVTSGFGDLPIVPLSDFGQEYDHTESLMLNQELQLVGGRYRIPVAVDYSMTTPSGSPDYSNVNLVCDFRYVTYAIPITKCINNGRIDFIDPSPLNDDWGDATKVASDLRLTVRIIGESCDSGWLDANSFYDGEPVMSTGSGCLLRRDTSPFSKNITFVNSVTGTLYIRIGLACVKSYDSITQQPTPSAKSFSSVEFRSL